MSCMRLSLRIDKVRAEMEQRGWRQVDLAYHAGLTEDYVSKLLNGERRPGPRAVAGLLRAFPELSFDDLFEVVQDGEKVAS